MCLIRMSCRIPPACAIRPASFRLSAERAEPSFMRSGRVEAGFDKSRLPSRARHAFAARLRHAAAVATVLTGMARVVAGATEETSAPPFAGLWRPADDSRGAVRLREKEGLLIVDFRGAGSVRTEFFRCRLGASAHLRVRAEASARAKPYLVVQTLDERYGGLDYVIVDLPHGGGDISRDLALNPNAAGFLFHLRAEGAGMVTLYELSVAGRPVSPSLHVSALAGPPDHNPAADARTISAVRITLLPPRPHVWDQVAIGGGGTVRAIRSHPLDGTVAIGADVAGVFYWDRDRARFDAKLDFLGPEDYGTFHTDIIAFDPRDAATLFYVGGKEWKKGGGVLVTRDRGRTWRRGALVNPDGRPVFISNASTAPRLSVDPHDGRIAWYGSRRDGLYRTTDRGATWRNVPVPGLPWNRLSVPWILPLPGDAGASRTATWLAAFAPHGDASPVERGLYRTDDDGATWRKTDWPYAANGNLSPDGRWLLLSDKRLWRVALDTGAVEEITPLDLATTGGKMWGYSTLAASPDDSDRLVVFTRSHGDGACFRSRDGGATWERFDNHEWRSGKRLVYEHAPYEAHVGGGCHVFNGVWDATFDAADPKRLWVAFWPGVLSSPDIWATPLVFRAMTASHEETCVFDLIAPARGAPLISGLMDVGGFVHWDITRQPETTMVGVKPEGPHGQMAPLEVTSLDFCEARPEFIVAAVCWRYHPPPDGRGTGHARYSDDGGRTWRTFPTKQPFPGAKDGRIAVSATEPDNIVWLPRHDSATGVWMTRDRGATWQPGEGAPGGLIWPDLVFSFYKPLAADRVRGGVFYLYDKADGRFYRSADGGARWRHVSRLPAQGAAHYVNHRVLALPGMAGHLLAALQEQGLFRSIDGGETWTRLADVLCAESVGAGAPPAADAPPTLWLLGTIGGETDPPRSVYRSDDLGASWARIDDASLGWPSESTIVGDRQTPGRVYVGTNGRGIFTARSAP
jgi:xyloglucan-specific exo-beta-1,4-glucanase